MTEASERTETIPASGTELACLRIGEGTPLVIIPGGPRFGFAHMRPSLDALASGRERGCVVMLLDERPRLVVAGDERHLVVRGADRLPGGTVAIAPLAPALDDGGDQAALLISARSRFRPAVSSSRRQPQLRTFSRRRSSFSTETISPQAQRQRTRSLVRRPRRRWVTKPSVRSRNVFRKTFI